MLLTTYSLGLYFCTTIFLYKKLKHRSFSTISSDSISVLIPARNEGGLAVLAIESLFQQDHSGSIDIYLLVKDGADSSIDYLQQLVTSYDDIEIINTIKEFRNTCSSNRAGQIFKLTKKNNKTVYIALTNLNPKSQKINWIVESINTKFIAILDCDNRAQPDWLRSSLALLAEQKKEIIQGRRYPILTNGFYKFWDSLHQHTGCELLNISFTRLKMTVFFTGTTVVMLTALLRANPLSDSITEDIDFSYGLFMRGTKIIANPYSGSNEETSPDLYSFIARRRRWANGHTSAFLKHFPLLISAPIKARDRIQFLFHGIHYLIGLGVFILHSLIGIYFFDELSWLSKCTVLISSLIASIGISQTQNTVGKLMCFFEILLIWCWLAPIFIIVMNVLHALMVGDLSRAALPIENVIQIAGLIGVGAPLITLIIGLFGFGQSALKTILKCLFTYPIAFYLDIAGILLGLLDCMMGQSNWRPLSRGNNHTTTQNILDTH